MVMLTSLVYSTREFLERRAELYDIVSNSPEITAAGVQLYPYDIVGSNFPVIVELLRTSGSADFLSEKAIKTVLDVGGANGDLSFIFAQAGFETTLVDLSMSYQNGPLVASLINRQLGNNVRVVDLSVDGYFCYRDLLDRTVNPGENLCLCFR